MRVLHLANGNLFGGIETFLVTLARLEQSDRSLENRFLLSHRGRLSMELEAAGSSPYVVEGVRLRHPWSVLRARRECRACVRELHPDVVVAHGPWTYVVFGQGLPAGEPLVFFQHGVARRDVLHLLAARRLPVGVIAASSQTAATTKAIFPFLEPRICPIPILPRAPIRPRPEVRSDLDAADEPIILTVARLEPGKGHSLLLHALGELVGRPWKLWIVGGWSRRSEVELLRELEGQAEALGIRGRVTFLGERSDVQDLMNAADIFCQASTTQEGFGLSLIEAMGAGLPLVVTEPAAIADPVGPEIGRRVRPVAGELAAAVDELLTDEAKRRRLGAAGRQRFMEHFASGPALDRLRDALTDLSKRDPTGRVAWA
jgi:glycosyltransferase involved in cell wall biosynthesis